LHLSQRAPEVLRNSPSSFGSSPLSSLFSSAESPELWLNYENLMLSCLRTGDEQAAHECLERLAKRFGDNNERVMAFKGLLKEADAENDAALEKVLKEYDQILSDKNTNIVSSHPSLTRGRRKLMRPAAHHQAENCLAPVLGPRTGSSIGPGRLTGLFSHGC